MFKKSVSARRAGAAVTCALLTALGGGGALANGRSPASVSVHPRQGSATDLAIWTTWGLLVRRDSGGFEWMCENAVKVGGAFDPTVAFRADGAIVATSFEGLLINRDRCVFEATPLGVKFVSTLALAPDGALYAAVSETNDSKIYRSGDGGDTFGAGVDAGVARDYWQSIAVAPSALPAPAPAGTYRVYLAGFRLDAGVKTPLLFRSDDNGASYRALTVPQPGTGLNSDLEIAAVSPTDPSLVFARVTYAMGDTVGDRFYRSSDAGQTWREVLYVDDSVRGFVVRGNGEVLAASATKGTWKSTNGGLTFLQQPTSLQTQCLVERSDGTLLACAQNFDPDNMSVGSSTDGTTWTKVFRFSEAVGPVDCAADTLQCDVCAKTAWCALREQFGITADPTGCATPGADETVCSGVPRPKSDDSGCCGVGGGPSSALLALLVTGVLALRRRKG